ncbi:hypothetical protein BO71DRAFT_397843 [Aspergillus ellipticus CBS 707.79]|uniref:Uncharacterized protein n=1 Tax=Aspergillus ellipticus CBS 707.79 TaxID=1448320 RepID=A0A319EVW2_9EURO|nr:hypothetical protein BO71DRAFT_397843 [Aspergillus ellipticus CBS 707.79]
MRGQAASSFLANACLGHSRLRRPRLRASLPAWGLDGRLSLEKLDSSPWADRVNPVRSITVVLLSAAGVHPRRRRAAVSGALNHPPWQAL